ncbi:MAG: hypothetical protein NC349_10015 [Paenibacillus sp.]|nr:hypothetical protein [Paenibacillus sp.]
MNRILKAVSPLFLALLAVSCSDDTTVSPAVGPDDSGKVNFEINVYAGDPEDTGSRTSQVSRDTQENPDWEGDYFYPEEPDFSPERMHTLRVIIVRPSGEIEANEYLYRSFPQAGASQFNGIRLKVMGGEKKRIYLFANEASIPGLDLTDNAYRIGEKFPTDAMASWQLSASGAGQPVIDNTGSDKTNIPMTEMFEVDVKAPESEADFYQTANLFITRALSKFSFTVTSTDTPTVTYSIEELKISSIAESSFLFPNNATYVPAKEPASFEDRYITSYEVPEDANVASYSFAPGKAFEITPEYTPNKELVYTPRLYFAETKLREDMNGKQVYTLSVRLNGDDDYCATDIPLPNLPSLPRNTHVKVNLTLTKSDVKCTVDVLPYTAVPLNPSFGFDELLPRPPVIGEIPPWVIITPEDNGESNQSK